MTRIKLSLVFVIIVSCLLCINSSFVSAGGEEFIGKASPEFAAKDLDGNDLDLKSLKGKTVLVNFWGLRCGACIEEMPHLNNLHDKYKDDGLVILGINADGIDGEFLKGPRGMANLPVELKYTAIQDPEMKLIDTFKMEAAPLNIIIDKEGIVRYYHMGYEPGDEKELEEKVAEAIKK
jgi:thiol-disulfide isomerase/thioredoxin